jgi:type II secretory pathway pseudopilin PulG
MLKRLRSERGFGLIELLMAMTMLNIGILAIIAAFNAGAVGLRRASRVTTAASLADQQMELYRAQLNANILLTTASATGADANYDADAACINPVSLIRECRTSGKQVSATSCPAGVPANACSATRSAGGPDHHNYRVDTFIWYTTPTGGRQLTQVTVVVRDSLVPGGSLARETSTFDASSG